MTCGIYLLTFESGAVYVGQSVDIESRWNQHFDKMRKGKAAARLQREYDQYGAPSGEVIQRCHKDFLDVLEACFIREYCGTHTVLNGTIPPDELLDYPQEVVDLVIGISDRSLIELVTGANRFIKKIALLEDEIEELQIQRSKEDIDNGIAAALHAANAAIEQNKHLLSTLKAERDKTWWQRLFS